MDHQIARNKSQLADDIMISWSYTAQRQLLLGLRNRNNCLQTRCQTLEMQYNDQTEFLQESQRQWRLDKLNLIAERDDFKKKWQKMVKAHEQALADLKRVEGTAEGQRGMIIVLTQEKEMLQSQVEELEEHKARMAKQLAELREELAKIRQEVQRLTNTLRETEAVLVDTRMEVEEA